MRDYDKIFASIKKLKLLKAPQKGLVEQHNALFKDFKASLIKADFLTNQKDFSRTRYSMADDIKASDDYKQGFESAYWLAHTPEGVKTLKGLIKVNEGKDFAQGLIDGQKQYDKELQKQADHDSKEEIRARIKNQLAASKEDLEKDVDLEKKP